MPPVKSTLYFVFDFILHGSFENIISRITFGNKNIRTRNIIIIISLLMSPMLGHGRFLWITHKEYGPSAGW
jgi:hypothetical protein